MCRACDLKPVNHLVYQDKAFWGGLTFKQNKNRISQIDWALISSHALSHVAEIRILSTIKLQTNHVAIALQLKGFYTPASNLLEQKNWVPHMNNKLILIYIQYQGTELIMSSFLKPYQLLMTCRHSMMTQVHYVVNHLTVCMIQPESQDKNLFKGITLHTQMLVNIGIILWNMVTQSKYGKP